MYILGQAGMCIDVAQLTSKGVWFVACYIITNTSDEPQPCFSCVHDMGSTSSWVHHHVSAVGLGLHLSIAVLQHAWFTQDASGDHQLISCQMLSGASVRLL